MGKLFVTPALTSEASSGVFAPPRRDFVATLLNFCSCTYDKLISTVAPGLAHLHAINILHLDYFLVPINLLPRHCIGAHLPIFCNRGNLPTTYQLCTATLVMLNRHPTMTAKHAPYLPCLPAGRLAP